jgi:dolichol-phosphate mannosyltransferase
MINTPFSIIVPTYREVTNVPALVQRIGSVDFKGRLFEVILVDDNSNDGTVERVEELKRDYPWLKILVRSAPRNLSQSVLDGYAAAIYPLLIIMDADLSHPPEKIPEILLWLDDPKVDLVLGSRYIDGGGFDKKWPLRRVLISRFSALLANVVLSAKVKDPLSGFVGIRKERYSSGGKINTLGWKIGLELMVKCHCVNIKEVPIIFSERSSGKSKLNLKIGLEYITQVIQLFFFSKFVQRGRVD